MQKFNLSEAIDLLVQQIAGAIVDEVSTKLRDVLAKDQNNNPSTPELYTAKEVCQILQITRQTLYKWESNGKLKPIRINGIHLRYVRADVDNLLRKERAC